MQEGKENPPPPGPSGLYQHEAKAISSVNQQDFGFNIMEGDPTPLRLMKHQLVQSPFLQLRIQHLKETHKAVRIFLPFQCLYDLQHAANEGERLIAEQRFEKQLQYAFRVIPEDQLIVDPAWHGSGQLLVDWNVILSQSNGPNDMMRSMRGVIRILCK